LTYHPAIFVGLIASLLSFPGHAQTDFLIANVYQDDRISVNAGIVELENRIINFGDVIPMIIEISYNPGNVRMQEIDTAFFTEAWPENMGAYLLDHVSSAPPEPGSTFYRSRHIYRFQILACPEGAVLCKGSRFYELPEFTLQYHVLDETGSEVSTESVQFRPWQTNLMIASAIPLGEEGELNSFSTYFPTGAYPNPLTGLDYRHPSAGLVAGGLFLLLGGILMSPFSFLKRKAFAARSKTRWEEVLDILKSGDIQNEKEFVELLRKCLVWYCVDELDVDPFYWLKHEEEVALKEHHGVGNLAEHRDLFIDLLHSPSGENDILLERLTSLIANES
jgi:hypothetical protein